MKASSRKAAPIAALISLFLLPNLWADQEGSGEPILLNLQNQLGALFQPLKPAARIEIPEAYGGRSLILRYQTRTYQIHPSNKRGVEKRLVEAEGPDNTGVLLKVHVQPKGEVNQAVVPQTLQRPYWKTDLAIYPVGDADSQLYVALSYRPGTDDKLLKAIRKILTNCEEPPATPTER